jgi:hypothetical protein
MHAFHSHEGFAVEHGWIYLPDSPAAVEDVLIARPGLGPPAGDTVRSMMKLTGAGR